ncbi:hypothetical protein BGZ51_001991, partial [Haplosporangium sp. Z 767]
MAILASVDTKIAPKRSNSFTALLSDVSKDSKKPKEGKKAQCDQVGDAPMEEPSDVESRLPPLCDNNASFTNYAGEVGSVKERLDGFDNTNLPARAPGYIVVSANEYYTSKKCPMRRQFVGQMEIHRLYCKIYRAYMHRDVMADHNICDIVRGHLMHQWRSLYLQLADAKSNY